MSQLAVLSVVVPQVPVETVTKPVHPEVSAAVPPTVFPMALPAQVNPEDDQRSSVPVIERPVVELAASQAVVVAESSQKNILSALGSDKEAPVPPAANEISVAEAPQTPVAIVPNIVIEVVPALSSKDMVPKPRDVLPVAATKLAEPPSHLRRSV